MNILPFDKQLAAISCLTEGMSIRSTERLTGIHRDTIMRLGARVGAGCAKLHNVMMRDLNVAQLQLDELWAYIGKKERRTTPDDAPEKGDCYTFIALDATNRAIISYMSGKRDGDTTRMFAHDLRNRLLNAPVISSDSFRHYPHAIRTVFGQYVDYGQIVKTYVGEPAPDAARRYSPGIVVAVKRRAVFGDPPHSMISTSLAERQNLSVRMASRRFTRLTNGYSKKAANHAAAVSLYVGHYNLCRVHETLRMTPAMALGITDHPWSIAELIETVTARRPEPEGRQIGRFRVIDGGLS